MPMNRINSSVKPIRDNIIVEEMHFGDRITTGGIIVLSDDGLDRGIRPRWAKVYAVGHEQTDIKPGEYVLVSHGRWSRGIEINDGEDRTIRRVDPKDVLLVSDEPMADDNVEMQRYNG